MRSALLFQYEDRPVNMGVLMTWNWHTTRKTLARGGYSSIATSEKRAIGDALRARKALTIIADGASNLLIANSKGEMIGWIPVIPSGNAVPEEWSMVPRRFRRLRSLLVGRDLICTTMPGGELYLLHRDHVFKWSHIGWRRISGPSIAGLLASHVPEPAAKAITDVVVEMAFRRKGGLIVVTPHPESVLSNGSGGLANIFRNMRTMHIDGANLSSMMRLCSIDGCVVIDSHGVLHNAGVILNVPPDHARAGEGARTAAASYASTYGIAVKVSQDGPISVYEQGKSRESLSVVSIRPTPPFAAP